MKIQVRHATTYTYDNPGAYLVQRMYLTPRNTPAQKVLDWHIEAPGMETALRYIDAFGNEAHLVTPPAELAEVSIVATGHIETTDTAGVLGQDSCMVPVQAFLAVTEPTKPNAEIRALAKSHESLSGVEQLHAVSASILDKVAYALGTTNEHTSAADAIRDGQGVCQDHVHIFISAARLLGVPARYVSGYMVVGENELAEASHAWAEAWVPVLGWVGFDVSNQVSPGDRYVRVATGMDVNGATPVKGVRRGFATGLEHMHVEVLVEQVADQ